MSRSVYKRGLFMAAIALASALAIESLSRNASTMSYGETSTASASVEQEEKNPFDELRKRIAGQEQRPAGEVFKNLKIFKDMPAGRLLAIMQVAFSQSLGVSCDHCHTIGDWEKEDKPAKEKARKMWAFMGRVNKDLKETLGEGAVNCTTCHRGQVKPALNLPSSK